MAQRIEEKGLPSRNSSLARRVYCQLQATKVLETLADCPTLARYVKKLGERSTLIFGRR